MTFWKSIWSNLTGNSNVRAEELRIAEMEERIQKGVAEALARIEQDKEIAKLNQMRDPQPVQKEEPPGEEPRMRITISALPKGDGLEATYDMDSNVEGVRLLDRSYEHMPKWNRMMSPQDKAILFLYDAISTLAEPLLPDATITELDLRRSALEAPDQPWVTNSVDVANAKRYGD